MGRYEYEVEYPDQFPVKAITDVIKIVREKSFESNVDMLKLAAYQIAGYGLRLTESTRVGQVKMPYVDFIELNAVGIALGIDSASYIPDEGACAAGENGIPIALIIEIIKAIWALVNKNS